MASYQWIKLYDEILDDPKMGRLSDGAYRFCINLFLLASRQEKRDGSLPDLEDIAWTLRLNDETAGKYWAELEKAEFVWRDDLSQGVTHFATRQGPIDSTERSRQSRERNKPEQKQRNESLQPSQRSRDTWATNLWRTIPAASGIYKITCSGSGLSYIGASVNMQSRIRAHLSEMSSTPHHVMSGDFAEYGHDSLAVEVLEECPEVELRGREQYWINQYPDDGTYNRESAGKRHHSWPEQSQQNVATNRCTDIDIDQDKEEDKKRGNIYIAPLPDAVSQMIGAIAQISGVTYADHLNGKQFEDTAYALIGNDITPDDLQRFGAWWSTNGHYSGKPAIKSILTKVKAAKDAGWIDLPKPSSNGNGRHQSPDSTPNAIKAATSYAEKRRQFFGEKQNEQTNSPE